MSSEPAASDVTRFEISPRGTEWQWVLYDDEEMLAYSPTAYQSVNGALGAIDQLWSNVSVDIYGGGSGFETVSQDDQWIWRLITGERGAGETLAIGSRSYATEEQVTAAVNRFRTGIGNAPVRVEQTPTAQPTIERFDVGRKGRPVRALRSLFGRGNRHRRIIKEAEIQIAVSGIRGKSSTTKRLDDVFNRRGYDTLTKITGDRPTLLRNGEITPIERHSPRVTLYENVELFQRLGSTFTESPAPDIALVENQAITEYTMRMVNERFLDPDIVVLCNVRQDHTDTLGGDRQRIARSFARSIPRGAHVISGEQHPVIHEYLRREIEKRGGTISQVEIPDHHRGLISAETVYALNDVLKALDEPTLSDARLAEYLASAQPAWSLIDGQRVFNAAKTNDIESTEAIRRALVDGDEQVLPFVYLRGDRRSRSASFAEYLNILADRECIAEAHVSGDHQRAFADAVDVPCTLHSTGPDATAVLDELLAVGKPIILMGNTVAPFMRDMERVLAARIADSTDTATATDSEAGESSTSAEDRPDGRTTAASLTADGSSELRPSQADRARFEVHRDRAQEYRWRFRDDDGTIRADSGEGYNSKASSITAAGRFRTQATTLAFEAYEDNAGEYRWRAKSKNGRIVADGTRGYDDRGQADRAVENVRRLVKDASIIDTTDSATVTTGDA